MIIKTLQKLLTYTGLVFLLSQGISANSGITKISEQYGDLGLYETYKLHAKGDSCTYVLLHDDTIVDTTCQTLMNSKNKKIFCTKKKKICKLEDELLGKVVIAPKKLVKNAYAGYAKNLAEIERGCKTGDKLDCYAVKRYKVFKSACDKGDKHSCQVLSNLIEARVKGAAGDASYLQSVHWILNTEKTSAGK